MTKLSDMISEELAKGRAAIREVQILRAKIRELEEENSRYLSYLRSYGYGQS